jgi:hypothetical protein
MRSRLTGHGHASNNGQYPHCCEWKDNTHYLFANGQQVDDWHIWQTNECALNPVYPQGGTWLGSREGWCPGDKVDVHETDLTSYVNGGSISVDYDITPVPASNQNMGNGNYVASFEFMEYAAPSHNLDAEIYMVTNPSDYEYYRRTNPICSEPTLILRNAGGQTLTSATITYGVSGGTAETYTWTGSLAHMEKAEIKLPVPSDSFWLGDSLRLFTATVSMPNGSADEYGDNDSYTTEFNLPDVYYENFIVVLRANNYPNQNSYTIKDIQGNVVHSMSGFTANTIHYDTLNLPAGCYTFELLDTGNDGLQYWADPGAGYGYCRFKRVGGSFLESFEREFGRSIVKSFALGGVLNADDIRADKRTLDLFPNPSTGILNLHLTHFSGDAVIEIRNATGQLIESERTQLMGDDRFGFDLDAEANGLYTVQILNDGQRITKRWMLRR